MIPEQSLNKSPGETAQSPAEHAMSCWLVLVRHCEAGRCTCHIGAGGSVHVLNGCVTGRMLFDEYKIASRRNDPNPDVVSDRVRELNGNLSALLEDGDMGSTLCPDGEGCADSALHKVRL